MILLEDIIDPWRRLLGKKGESVKLMADHQGAYIVEDIKGNRFPVTKDKLTKQPEGAKEKQ